MGELAFMAGRGGQFPVAPACLAAFFDGNHAVLQIAYLRLYQGKFVILGGCYGMDRCKNTGANHRTDQEFSQKTTVTNTHPGIAFYFYSLCGFSQRKIERSLTERKRLVIVIYDFCYTGSNILDLDCQCLLQTAQ